MSSEPTQQHDAYDRFAEICHEFREYPKLQLQSQKPQDAFYAEQQWKKLHERQEDLFDDDEAELSFWETGRSNKFPRQAVSISDLDTLRNDLFEKRIKDTCHLLDIPSETAQLDKVDVSPYLKASLDTHVVYLSWCDENWRSFINDVEAAVRKIVDPVNGALVDDHIDRSNGRANSWPSSTLGSWLKREKNPVSDPEKGNPAPEQSQNLSFISSTLDPHGTLDRFRFRDLQSLHKHADVVQKTSLVLELNIGVLRDIDDYYKYLAATEFQDTPQAKAIIEEFLREVSAISRRLETRMKQLRSLNAYLDQGMALYEKVLQQRSNQISTMFAEIAMANNQQMQQISDKTAKQTTSMHVITVATLFFLPATFVAVRATCPSIGNLI
ncbi:hypothetical protein CFRS1_v002532 [Colletotrichum fructicola]|nr:hypothetical protein CFRS1_v002532 [Colletotrichum fructicola]